MNDVRACAVPSRGHHADAAPVELRVGHEDGFDFIDDGLGLGFVDVTLAVAALDEHIDQGRVEPFVRLWHAQRPDVALVELPVRELDDGGHAAEVLFEHHRVASEHHSGQVVDGLVRRHLRPVRLVREEPVDELLDFLFGGSHCGGRDLLVVADDEHLLATQKRRQRPDVRLRRFVDDDKVEEANLGRNGLGHPPLRQHPAGHRLVRPKHRVAGRLPVANRPHAIARAHRLDSIEVRLQGLTHRVRRVVENAQPGLLRDEVLVRPGQRCGQRPALVEELAQLVMAVDAVEEHHRLAPVPRVEPRPRRGSVKVSGRWLSAKAPCPLDVAPAASMADATRAQFGQRWLERASTARAQPAAPAKSSAAPTRRRWFGPATR
jgi:hypothetical protein